MTRLITALLLTLGICLSSPAQQPVDTDHYQAGQTALREQDFNRAIEAFERAQSLGQRTDAAAYWHAYALFQAGRKRQATSAARSLLRRFPRSEWADDAQALIAEMDAENVGDGAEEELRLYALYHLIEANPERGMALLRNMLEKTESPQTKRHLLFLLAGHGGESVSQEIVRLARDNSDPELQVQAIHIIAASGNQDAVSILGELYNSDLGPEVRRAIIDAHIAADSPRALAKIVRQESNPELKQQGIMALGAMDATEELRGLYSQVSQPTLRRALLEAFAISGDVAELANIIASEQDPSVRAVAIRSLGIAGDDDSARLLEKLAASSTSPAEQRAILEAVVMIDGGADVAVAIARRASDPAILRQAVQTLGILDAGESILQIYDELDRTDPEVQRAVLDALAMSGHGVEIAVRIARDSDDPSVVAQALHTLAMLDASSELRSIYDSLEDDNLRRIAMQQIAMTDDPGLLLKILEKESSPSIRADAIRALSMSHGVDGEQLAALYENAASPEKHAIIDALMIQDSDEALVSLLESETDTALRRKLLQALLATGSELAEDYLFQWLEDNE